MLNNELIKKEKMREIGSEFWTGCSPTGRHGCKWHQPKGWILLETLSGRVALEYVVESLKSTGATSVYMPSYCCHTMIEPFLKHGLNVAFYDVVLTETGMNRQFNDNHGSDVVFLLDYFGHIDKETATIAQNQKPKGKTVIYDATHSIYSDVDPMIYDYVFGSYRKWMDVNCGFVATKSTLDDSAQADWKQFEEYVDMRTRMFDLKSRFMNGEDVDKQLFLTWISEAEEMLEQNYHHTLPDSRSLDVLERTDLPSLMMARRNNAKILMQGIAELADERIRCFSQKIGAHDIPLFVPVWIQADIRNDLRRYLIEHCIYCPVHWPLSDLHVISDEAKKLYQSELSLVCDQRYDHFDMYRIVETIKNYLKK